jgi:glyoxylase-like metal-dependent hydrolase (beta-lactamase superfamily II)
MITCAAGHATAQSVRLERVAPGVFLQRGAMAAPSTGNAGMVANLGVIVGASGAIAINTGTSVQHGESLIASIDRLTDKPVLLAINTQASPDQVLGNGAFARRGIPVLAHRETDRFMVRTCDICIRNLVTEVGEPPLRGTQLSRPTWLIDESFRLEVAGRSVDILHFGWTAHFGSLAVYDRATGVLFAGDLASFDVIPDVQHARLAGWLDALQRLDKLDARLVVPGRGPVGRSERLAEMRRYLASLATIVERGYRRGLSLGEITQHAPLADFEQWVLYADRHPRNVHFAYLALEQEELRR